MAPYALCAPNTPDGVWVIGRGIATPAPAFPAASQVISRPQDRNQSRLLADVTQLSEKRARVAPS